MPHTFQISRDSEALFITLVTRNRLPVFKTDTMKAILCRAIDEARTSGGFLLFAYVLMLDHMHLLTNRPKSTADVLRVLKGITARRVIDYLKEKKYLDSLAKLQHQERERNYRYSLWQTKKNVVRRTYTITPTGGSGYAATLRLHYLDSELNGTAGTTFAIDLYASPSCNSLGNGEGQTYLGSATVGTNGSCLADFTGG
jgi:REP element-mobilizing transposase RayT